MQGILLLLSQFSQKRSVDYFITSFLEWLGGWRGEGFHRKIKPLLKQSVDET
jgi:hypothetical protein